MTTVRISELREKQTALLDGLALALKEAHPERVKQYRELLDRLTR